MKQQQTIGRHSLKYTRREVINGGTGGNTQHRQRNLDKKQEAEHFNIKQQDYKERLTKKTGSKIHLTQ